MGSRSMQLTSIDLSELPADLAEDIAWTIAKYERKKEKNTSWQHVLDHGTDEEIINKAAGECYTCTPLVLASVYKNDGDRGTLIYNFRMAVPFEFNCHPRRAIVMRGARLIRYARHALSHGTNPNGWAVKVFERALRMSKKTLLSYSEMYDFMRELARRVASKHPGVTSSFWQRTMPPRIAWLRPDERLALINGKYVTLTDSEYDNVCRLFKIIRKTDKLDERLKLAQESRRY